MAGKRGKYQKRNGTLKLQNIKKEQPRGNWRLLVGRKHAGVILPGLDVVLGRFKNYFEVGYLAHVMVSIPTDAESRNQYQHDVYLKFEQKKRVIKFFFTLNFYSNFLKSFIF